MADMAYEIAATRLMSVIDKPTCEERRISAEWVLDGILDALKEAFADA